MAEEQEAQEGQEQEAQEQKGQEREEELSPEARRRVEEANAEAAARRHELKAMREELETLKRERESDAERLTREAEERGAERAAGEYAPRLLEADLAIAAAGRLRDPQDAVGLIRASEREELLGLTDRDERRKRADAIISALLEAKPYLAADTDNGKGGGLVTQGARSGGAPGRSAKSPDDWLREEARRR